MGEINEIIRSEFTLTTHGQLKAAVQLSPTYDRMAHGDPSHSE